ncbi:MAG: SH3 domain-containing protein [Romboutsia sp.]
MKKTIATIGIGAVAISMSSIEASAMEKGIINTSALNIRSGPSTDYSRVDKAYKGETVEILEQSNGWNKVKLNNGTVGWGSGQYIDFKTQSNTPQISIQGKSGKVTASPRVNIRSGAGTNYSVVAKSNYGEVIEILEKTSNGWYKVKLSNGLVGFGSNQYIVETVSSNNNENIQKPPTTIPVKSKKGKVTASPSLNIRNGAGSNYSVIGKVSYGQVVELLEKSSNGWYKVKISNGTIGWGSGQYIVETTTSSENNNNDNSSNNVAPPHLVDRTQVVNLAYSLIGTPYEWGAEGPNSFDCSGFTKYVYSKALGRSIPRVSRDQAKQGIEVFRSEYLPGDLVYFDTDGDNIVNHVGIYVGNNEFIHCSGTPTDPDSVRKDNLGTAYWKKVLVGARRF